MAALTGKTALVIGASRGIGRAIAQRLASNGALVGVHYGTDDEAAKQTLTSIEGAGGKAFLVRAQLGVDGDLDALFEGLDRGLDGQPLDILVNNAGILDPTLFDQVTPGAFDESYVVNVRTPFSSPNGPCPDCATVDASSTSRRRSPGSPARSHTTP